ncbi:5-methyltetrahydropteroyltriglutamate--homocysteine S-methyltransferase [Williamsia sp. MIQD14]|uniref:5-methyltetrahydropteroyltriglutamate-- homocysteine S-methyltransferase n=1 Tax=Williamsia sp. MIQD14 TaxID=3425703 RepID=UPI003D9FB445
MTGTPFTATTLGSARIGPNRQLKRAVESYWAGRTDQTQLRALAADLRRAALRSLRAAGLDSIPVNTFSFYDQMLDTAALLGALPPRVADIDDELDRYFAAARGTGKVAPLEMTKWFDTNYHYLVPEISASTTFALHPGKILDELAEAVSLDIPARPVVIGPITFLLLSKGIDGTTPVERLHELIPLYRTLLSTLREAGAEWVQIDEPALVTDLHADPAGLATQVYGDLAAGTDRPAILVASYFGDLGDALPALAATDIEALAVDLVRGSADAVAAVPTLRSKLLVAGVVDGRNIWRNDLSASLATLATLLGSAASVAVSTSCSTLHVPHGLGSESRLDDTLRSWLAFGEEKVAEVVTLATALRDGRDAVGDALDDCARSLAARRSDPRVHDDAVRRHVAAAVAEGITRGPAAQRRATQDDRLGLPVVPATTIGSYPQTSAIRRARAALRADEIGVDEYERQMRDEVASVIALQEDLGLDVLVHGEPERNDMVQYFAEQLDGFFATENGWVQSYGTRCVRPPILYGDVRRRYPMTVTWIDYAQSLTDRPVKGMLTGPVTILAWSFVRDDQPLSDSANQIAVAIRDETVDLEDAGVGIIQVDEPALRELLPLRSEDQAAYLRWAVDAFRLSTSGVADATQIHTHLCYSEFGAVIGAISDLDADVTSIEAARSHMEVLDDLNAIGYANSVGPGVYDIHSPRVPEVGEIVASLRAALDAVPAQRLWINPDCGLKTRSAEEVEASLRNLVTAAHIVRAEL